MNRHTSKKLKKVLWRTSALLLTMLMLSTSAFAVANGGIVNGLLNNTAERYDPMKETYGEDWEEVAALQPGDSYMGEEFIYLCQEETRVEWTRVRSKSDLDGSYWGGERLLLLTSTDGKKLFVGNDYVNPVASTGGYDYEAKYLNGLSPNAVWQELDNNTGEYYDVYRYPEMQKYLAKSTGGYPYPDSFSTVGSMNAPYLEYMGKDEDNNDAPMFRIILSRDDGQKSAVGLGLDSGVDYLELESAKKSDSVTFEWRVDKNKGGFLHMFYNAPKEDDVHFFAKNGKFTAMEDVDDYEAETYIAYLGKKYTARRIDVVSADLSAAQDPENLENVYGGMVEFYRWTGIISDSFSEESQNQRSLNKQYAPGARMLLVWDDKYFLQGDDFRAYEDEDGMALYVNEGDSSTAVAGNLADNPAFNKEYLNFYSKDYHFYTADGMGTPYLYYQGRDNESEYDYCWYFTIQLAGADDRPSDKWLCDADNALGICTEESWQDFKTEGGAGVREEHRVGFIIGHNEYNGKGYDNDCSDPHRCKLFFKDDPARYDTGLYAKGNVLYGDDDWWGWDFTEFKMFIGTKVAVPAVRQDYIVGDGQFMHISQNGAMLQDVTIIVQEGGVLSVESWFMNNGRIIVDGGTLIVQDASNPLGSEFGDDTANSTMMPYIDIHPTLSGSLYLKNGGELIVLDNAQAAFSSIQATTGSSILNNGTLLAETLTLQESTLDNREDGSILLGYDFREIGSAFRTAEVSAYLSKLTSRLQAGISCLTLKMSSAVSNEGSIRYATVRSAVEDESVREVGKGEYQHMPVKASAFKLN